MFPIRDHNPSLQRPFVTITLILINVWVFIAALPLAADQQSLMSFYGQYALIPARISSGDGMETFVTSMFLHGSFMHLAGNMLFLWIFGDNLEEQLGHIGFVMFYLAAGVGAALLQFITAPFSGVPVVGASGAIAGVMGGYLLLFPRARVDVLFIFIIFFKVFSVPAWLMLGLWFAMQLFFGVTTDAGNGGVAYWAHAGGLIVGFLWVLPLWRRKGGRAFWHTNEGHPPHPEAKYDLSRTSIPRAGRRR